MKFSRIIISLTLILSNISAFAESHLYSNFQNPSRLGVPGAVSDLSESLNKSTEVFHEFTLRNDSYVSRVSWVGSKVPGFEVTAYPLFRISFHESIRGSANCPADYRMIICPDPSPIAQFIVEPSLIDNSVGHSGQGAKYSVHLGSPVFLPSAQNYWVSIAYFAPDINSNSADGYEWHWGVGDNLVPQVQYDFDTERYAYTLGHTFSLYGNIAE
ncbi:hypothetical protein [Agarilytica rhodophyticola]|uniref:hypothetical protein n=1 Tax=Agarilytica rhodophyticola TaxID=1737490 RepID=UPI000B343142|nr:hypothetical protein [Agarilytica rhodophyticola]